MWKNNFRKWQKSFRKRQKTFRKRQKMSNGMRGLCEWLMELSDVCFGIAMCSFFVPIYLTVKMNGMKGFYEFGRISSSVSSDGFVGLK